MTGQPLPEGDIRRKTGDMVSQLGTRFPGTFLDSLRAGDNRVRSCVTAYGRVQCDIPAQVTRWNLFGELDGTRQHYASAFAVGNFDGLLFSVAGHLADSWHVLAQSTSTRANVRAGLLSSDCCSEPSVYVPADRQIVPFNPGPISDAQYAAGFIDPPVSPVQQNRGEVRQLSYFSAAGVNTSLDVLNGSETGRVLWWQAVGLNAGANVSFQVPWASPKIYTIGTAAAQQAPEGNLLCSTIALSAIVFFAATVVR